METMDRQERESLQVGRLQELVASVGAAVPHYRRHFDESGIQSDSIRSLKDLEKLPFTTKQDLRRSYPFGMFAVPLERVVPSPRVEWNDRQAHCRRLHRA